jgi:excisionase family DNA binding protein
VSDEAKYLTARDVAEMLQVDESSVYRWAASDPSMPATRIGGVVRFDRVKLDAWLDQRTQGRRTRTSRATAA